MPTRRLIDLFRQTGPDQHRVLQKAQRLQQMQTQLSQLLPADLAPHVTLTNLRGSLLLLSADSNAWAMRLRYLCPDLLAQLRQKGWPCQRIDIKVATGYAPPPAPTVQRKLSPTARQLLRQTAQHLDNPELAASLKKLASHDDTT